MKLSEVPFNPEDLSLNAFLTWYYCQPPEEQLRSLLTPISLTDRDKALKATFLKKQVTEEGLPINIDYLDGRYRSERTIGLMPMLKVKPDIIGEEFNVLIHPKAFTRV